MRLTVFSEVNQKVFSGWNLTDLGGSLSENSAEVAENSLCWYPRKVDPLRVGYSSSFIFQMR